MQTQFLLNTDTYNQILEAEKQALKDTAWFVYDLLKEQIKDKAFDSGEYLKSLFLKSIGIGDIIQIWSSTPQAVIMEYGRRPLQKRPPLDTLIPRANRKGMINDTATKYKDLSSKDKSTIYLLAKSIGAKWITPRAIFRTVYDQHKDQINDFFTSKLKQYLW
jgi:hypothetical protein